MSDRSIGALVLIVSLAAAIAYVYWLFFPAPTGLEWLFYFNGLRLAVVVPMVIAVLAVLFIAMWIGWTMATTPPPTPIELTEEKPEAEKVEKKTARKAKEKK